MESTGPRPVKSVRFGQAFNRTLQRSSEVETEPIPPSTSYPEYSTQKARCEGDLIVPNGNSFSEALGFSDGSLSSFKSSPHLFIPVLLSREHHNNPGYLLYQMQLTSKDPCFFNVYPSLDLKHPGEGGSQEGFSRARKTPGGVIYGLGCGRVNAAGLVERIHLYIWDSPLYGLCQQSLPPLPLGISSNLSSAVGPMTPRVGRLLHKINTYV
ncbi:hypothetical protein E1301_Tti001268 [Triplophysa tibetana]|uniref:Uncharacterized protein n=1 Tax=Triplophysa tibetana TaxID=1572043 RepID=A0A5A9P864_9TELE|nr:hypothetical protein E1301_Tti001268 [Triplophysa tibetana]